MIRRLTADERKRFARYATDMNERDDRWCTASTPEPALGTLDERLDIIIRRHGGRTGPVRLTPAERRQLDECREV